MAFDKTKLALIAQSPTRRIWDYQTADTAATVDTAGYFNNAADILKVYDIIEVVADTGGTPAIGRMLVNANNGSVVDVADLNAIGGTDTD